MCCLFFFKKVKCRQGGSRIIFQREIDFFLVNQLIKQINLCFQKSPAVNKEIQELKNLVLEQSKKIAELTEKVEALEQAACNVENDETLGNEKAMDQDGEVDENEAAETV